MSTDHRLASRTIGCELTFVVAQTAEVVLQVMASRSAGPAHGEHFEILTDGEPPVSLLRLDDPDGASMHIIRSRPGRLTASYRARVQVGGPGTGLSPHSDYERQVYLRPSRYCPSDHLTGFAMAEFAGHTGVGTRVAAITGWIRQRIAYVPGSSTVHDSAEDTLLTGEGTCRDFAHLGVALCRATGVPARFTAVYAPGLSPMDFHAVFEAFEDGRWRVHDPTGLAPRPSLVRVVTGRDAADTAFAAVTSGTADLERLEISAVAEPFLPVDDQSSVLELP